MVDLIVATNTTLLLALFGYLMLLHTKLSRLEGELTTIKFMLSSSVLKEVKINEHDS